MIRYVDLATHINLGICQSTGIARLPRFTNLEAKLLDCWSAREDPILRMIALVLDVKYFFKAKFTRRAKGVLGHLKIGRYAIATP